MNDKDKQIEQVFNDIVEIVDRPYYYDNKGRAHIDFVDLDKLAEKLSEKYQPKIPEDSVVPSREEYEGLKQEKLNAVCDLNMRIVELDNELKQVSKETAEKDFNTIINVLETKKESIITYYGVKESVGADIAIRAVKELAKQFGVKIVQY